MNFINYSPIIKRWFVEEYMEEQRSTGRWLDIDYHILPLNWIILSARTKEKSDT